jgi:hypothetical protein
MRPPHELEVRVLIPAGADELDPSLNGVYHRPGRGSTYEDMLRFGIAFADGRKATNVGAGAHGPGEPRELFPNQPTSHGGGTWSSFGTAATQRRTGGSKK